MLRLEPHRRRKPERPRSRSAVDPDGALRGRRERRRHPADSDAPVTPTRCSRTLSAGGDSHDARRVRSGREVQVVLRKELDRDRAVGVDLVGPQRLVADGGRRELVVRGRREMDDQPGRIRELTIVGAKHRSPIPALGAALRLPQERIEVQDVAAVGGVRLYLLLRRKSDTRRSVRARAERFHVGRRRSVLRCRLDDGNTERERLAERPVELDAGLGEGRPSGAERDRRERAQLGGDASADEGGVLAIRFARSVRSAELTQRHRPRTDAHDGRRRRCDQPLFDGKPLERCDGGRSE